MKKKALFTTVMLLCLCGMQVNAAAAEATRTIVNGQYVSSASANNKTDKNGPGNPAADNGTAEEAVNTGDAENAASKTEAADDSSAAGNSAAGRRSDTAESSFDPNRLKLPESASVLITLEGAKNSDTGILKLMEKKSDGQGRSTWTELLECTAMYGKNGLYKEREGDSKTPVGVFRMGVPFGRKPAEEGFPSGYIQVDDSYYWNGDSDSASYNKLVSTKNSNDFRRSESEHLINYGAYYNYCLDIGYNADGTPHKGSAIFLHCVVNNENTHGCVAVPEDVMKTVLKTYRDNATYMVIYDADDVAAVYQE